MSTDLQKQQKFPAGTLVFGLILVVVALTSLSRTIFNWQFDTPLLFIGLVALAGIVLIISGIASARKSKTKKSSTDEY